MPPQFEEEEILGKAYDSRLFKRLLLYLRPYKLHVAFGVVLLLLGTLLELAGPYIMKIAIDNYIAVKIVEGLWVWILLYVIVLIFHFSILLIRIYLMQWIGQKVVFDIRMAVFKHLQSLSIAFFDKNPVGRLVTRVTTDVEALNEWFSAGVVSIFGDIFLLAGIIIAMLNIQWKLALVTFSVLPLLIGITVFFRMRIRNAYREIRSRIARLNSFLNETITGMTVVQIFNRERQKYNQFKELDNNLLSSYMKNILYYSIFLPSIDLIESIALALIIWFGGLWHHSGQVTFGILVLFIQYSRRFFRPISDLTDKYNIMQSAMASSERIFHLLDEKPDITNPQQPKHLKSFSGHIEFRNVWFAYRNRPDGSPEFVLKDISFEVKPGEKIAFVGATGAGKSSIINLLCRFYDCTKGKILLDGIDIRKLNIQEMRRHIGLVLQDVFIFADTIKENIRLGNQEIGDEQIQKVAEYVNAHDFISRLPKKYDEPMMERGGSLSTGQKQLLAFARAMAFNPTVLILDEATSSVDTESEILIQNAMDKLMKSRTSICIAHRLSTVQNCDRIIVLHKGEIREQGTHQELLKLKGIYYKLYRLQYLENEKQRTS